MPPTPDQLAAALRSHKNALSQQQAVLNQQAAELHMMRTALADLQSRPRSVSEEIDAIEGRRLEGTLSGEISFDITDENTRGAPVVFAVSQDGPFVMTHYPLVLWRPSAPDNAANLGRWRPVSTFPLPDQVVDSDIIDLMYELQDGGSGRLLQNEARGPLFSRPDNIVPCPVPTLWSSNATILFTPTYLTFTWNGSPAPTAGILHVDLIGYRIANL
jgi:hypothetical protein